MEKKYVVVVDDACRAGVVELLKEYGFGFTHEPTSGNLFFINGLGNGVYSRGMVSVLRGGRGDLSTYDESVVFLDGYDRDTIRRCLEKDIPYAKKKMKEISIDIQWLLAHNACSDGMIYFLTKFGNAIVSSTRLMESLKRDGKSEYAAWLEAKLK